MTQLLRDARHALRVLAARPVLTATTVLTLALGIGGTSAMFSIASAVLLRPLPVPEAARLVRIFGTTEARPLGITSYPNLKDVADRARSFERVAIHQQTVAAYGLGEETASAATELVSGGYFAVFGVMPPLGRAIADGDDMDGNPQAVAVVSDHWWRSRLGADPGVAGRVIHLNGAPFTVIGVAPPSFRGSYDAAPTDLWVPLMTYPVVRPRGLDMFRRNWGWLQATARLAPGVPVEVARAEVAAIGAALAAEYPAENRNLRMTVIAGVGGAREHDAGPGPRARLRAHRRRARAARGVCQCRQRPARHRDRSHREIAVRMAMGATRGDIARLWLAESLVTTAVATGVGLLAAVWLRDGFLGLRPLTGCSTSRRRPISTGASGRWRPG